MPEEKNNQPFEKVYRDRRKMMLDNFLGGIAWSLGTLVGATIIFAVIGYILTRVDLVPIIGNWFGSILESSMKNRIQLPQ